MSVAISRLGCETIGIESAFDSAGTLAVKLEAAEGDALFSFACLDSAAALQGRCAQSLALTFSLPWMRIGPLSPTGIVREALNPLAFSPQSVVFLERAGLALDASEPASLPGILCMPVPDALGLFCIPGSNGAPEYGCFAACDPLDWLAVDCFALLCEPGAASAGEEWFFTGAPFPGGALLLTADRLACRFPPFSITGSAGVSFAERAPTGGYFHLDCQASGKSAHAALLFAGRDGNYRNANGRAAPGALSLSGSAGAAEPAGSVDGAYSLTVELPGFAPRPFRKTTERMSATLEEKLFRASGIGLDARLTAEKEVSFDEEGLRNDAASFLASVTATGKGFQAVAGFEMASPGATAQPSSRVILFSVEIPRLARGVGSGLEARLDFGRETELSALLTFTLSRAKESVRLVAGITDCPLGPAADPAQAPAGGRLVLKLSWSTRSAAGP